jgi:RNA 2',3'-cyclic 3'-phosphodiesterase
VAVSRPAGGPRRWAPAALAPGERRLFVAVPMAEAARLAVVALVDEVRGLAPSEPPTRDVRWVRLDGLHITLRFLGPTPEARIPELEAGLVAATAGQGPFTVRLAGAGAFPPVGRPRVLWLGIDEGAPELGTLAAGLGRALAPLGWPVDERPFRPHLSLARSDGVPAGPAVAERLVRVAAHLDAAWQADRVTLFETVSGGGPARYTALAEVPLKA